MTAIRWRFKIPAGLPFILLAGWIWSGFSGCSDEKPQPAAVVVKPATLKPPAPEISAGDVPLKDDPLTISASTVGRFARGHSWHLKVDPAGQAELSIETFPDRTVKQFQVSKEQLSEFRSALVEERFFDLNGEYGEDVVDGSEQSLTVAAGPRTNTVKVYFLMNWVHSDKARLREPRRAVRLLVLVRGWFDAAEAVDLRKYDKMVLDAAK